MKRLRRHLPNRAFLVYRAGVLAARLIPERVLFPLAEGIGWLAGRLLRGRRDVVRRNMLRAAGGSDVERLVDRAFRSYARYWVETLRIPSPGVDKVARRTTHEGLDSMTDKLGSRGVIFVTPHLGSWDVAGMWLTAHGWRVIAVAEELQPAELFALFVKLRRAAGMEIHPLGRPSSARALITGLREGAAVALVADRDISGSGVLVDFFGEPTWLPSGPAVLALRLGVPVAAGALYQRPGRRYHGVVLEPIEVEADRSAGPEQIREMTQRVARELETLIRRDPGQWHLFQPNWPSDPGYVRRP